MKRYFVPVSALVVCACSTSVHWTEGTWVVSDQAEDKRAFSDDCVAVVDNVSSVFQSIDPLRYELGSKDDAVDVFGVDTASLDNFSPLLTPEETEAGLSNLWKICKAPDDSPDFDCRHGIELLHADKWLPQVQEILNESYCNAFDEGVQVTSSYGFGGFISTEEALINSTFSFGCGSVPVCILRTTSRLRTVD